MKNIELSAYKNLAHAQQGKINDLEKRIAALTKFGVVREIAHGRWVIRGEFHNAQTYEGSDSDAIEGAETERAEVGGEAASDGSNA